jgi:hypothetical protein
MSLISIVRIFSTGSWVWIFAIPSQQTTSRFILFGVVAAIVLTKGGLTALNLVASLTENAMECCLTALQNTKDIYLKEWKGEKVERLHRRCLCSFVSRHS